MPGVRLDQLFDDSQAKPEPLLARLRGFLGR
jgi:hypothetical protein